MTMTSFSQLKTLFSVCALMLASLATGVASAETSRHARLQAWDANKASAVQMNPGLGVRAGQAPIEQALLTLVPPPYQIQLAQSIDRSTVLQWAENPDWYVGLRLALAQHSLMVQPDWDKNVLTVTKTPRSHHAATQVEQGSQAGRVAAADGHAKASASPPHVAPVAVVSVAAAHEPGAGISAAPSPVQQAAGKKWSIQPADGSLSRALMRWAREAGVQIAYEAPSDLAAISVAYDGDFWTALNGLLADTANGSYPLHGCQFNNITRILHISQPCDR